MAIGGRGLAQAFLQAAAQRGISVSEAIRQMRAAGIATYRRTDMLADYRKFAGLELKASRIKFVPNKYRPSKELYTELTTRIKTRFKYNVEVSFYRPAEGTRSSGYFYVVSDRQLSIGEIKERALSGLKAVIDEYSGENISAVVFQAFHKEGEPWE